MAPSILITGCGRSGTTYVSKLLCEAGLDLLHHDVGPDGSVDWCLAVTSDVPLPWGKKGRSSGDYVFDRVLHQVRAPLAVISSSMTIKDRSWDYISNFTSINPEDSAIKKSMLTRRSPSKLPSWPTTTAIASSHLEFRTWRSNH